MDSRFGKFTSEEFDAIIQTITEKEEILRRRRCESSSNSQTLSNFLVVKKVKLYSKVDVYVSKHKKRQRHYMDRSIIRKLEPEFDQIAEEGDMELKPLSRNELELARTPSYLNIPKVEYGKNKTYDPNNNNNNNRNINNNIEDWELTASSLPRKPIRKSSTNSRSVNNNESPESDSNQSFPKCNIL